MDTPCPPSPDPSTSFPARAPFYALFVPDLALTPSGDDDYFSSDLPDAPDGIAAHPLSESFGRLSVPALALYSEKDEYAHIADPEAHLARWRAAAKGHLTTVIIKDANHAVEDAKLHEGFCNEVVGWLGKHF